MKTDAPIAAGAAERLETATVQIDVGERRDALRLMEALIPFHSFLVQYERDRWVVHARVPGCHGESLDVLAVAVDDWAATTGVNEPTISLDDQPRLTTGTGAGGERS